MLNHAMQGVRQLINHNKHPHNTADANPFGKALDTPDDIVDELTRNAIKLNPLIKRHIIKGFEGIPSTLQLGWAQLPQTQGKAFSIGLFTDNNHFAQIALADSKARVFAGTNPEMDVQDLEPRFIFVKEETSPCQTVHDSDMRQTARRRWCARRKAVSWDACPVAA